MSDPNCPICGKRLLWIMRGAGCCLGPTKELERQLAAALARVRHLEQELEETCTPAYD